VAENIAVLLGQQIRSIEEEGWMDERASEKTRVTEQQDNDRSKLDSEPNPSARVEWEVFWVLDLEIGR